MGRSNKGLLPEHARALIKQAIGIINGEPQIVAEATVEIAAIRADRLSEKQVRGGHRRRMKAPPPRAT
jgi:hypothetical protein